MGWKQDVSRVLFSGGGVNRRRGRSSVWDRCHQRPRAAHFDRDWCHGQPLSLGLAPSRGLPSQHLSMLLVRSYRTFAPLPVPGKTRAIGGVFLWHSPHGHPHWALPSKPGHWGARTFLNQANLIATTSPASVAHSRQVALAHPGRIMERCAAPVAAPGAVAQPDRATVS